ncbi:YhcN/YlaJ family sporulation lipoprotein [Ornithinibacillus bavariensis]|uniref:YhcN/YlaJ family sporulation lipoprotein n=1 Tax=Ornithinibacillus bavariensis TaxID=545502 RepID=UPI003D1CEE3F
MNYDNHIGVDSILRIAFLSIIKMTRYILKSEKGRETTMKKSLFGIAASALIVLAGCGNGNNDDAESQRGTTNQNVDPVRYQDHDDANDNNRNYTLQRDLEEPNNVNTRNINNVNNRTNDNRTDNNNGNRYDVANEAADKIVDQIDVIERAYVLTTDNNAYVAAQLDDNNNRNRLSDNGDALTDDVKNKISTIVKSVDNDIDNVYVSTNPDFMNLTNNYVNDVDQGQPVEGFFEEMGNMIERIFPQNKGR